MSVAGRARDEQTRLDALVRYDVLDTPAEEAFDRITRLTSRMFGVPISVITFVDAHRQWFKSSTGLDALQTERRQSICTHVIEEEAPLVVHDLSLDARFKHNALVTGAPHLRFYAGVPLRTPEGVPLGTLCAVDTRPREFGPRDLDALSDLARLATDVLELRHLAVIDGLTGALSRRSFRQEAARALTLANRHRHDLAVLAFDVDHFKRVNDSHGHAAGDRVLRACVEACRAELKSFDLLGRIGGEEFAVILPRTGSAGALQVANRLRAAIAAIRIPNRTTPIAVSASFGIATLDRSADSLDALLAGADEALYAAKTDGRDCCRLWQAPAAPETPGPGRRESGRIVFDAGRSTVDCTVRAVSDQGAGLDVVSSAGIPDRFKLLMSSDGSSRC